MIKVFISHQQSDSNLAAHLSRQLERHDGVETYLDLIDNNVSLTGDQLGEYIRNQLGSCTQLLAVVSTNTKTSWWVPWEIGLATEKDYPIATYAGDRTELPEYLRKWPYLRSDEDLETYATESRTTNALYLARLLLEEPSARRSTTERFHKMLKVRLKQP